MATENPEKCKIAPKIARCFFKTGVPIMSDNLKRETHTQRQRRRYKEAGLIQINVWIPPENRDELLQDCARLRAAHLRHVGFYGPKDEDV